MSRRMGGARAVEEALDMYSRKSSKPFSSLSKPVTGKVKSCWISFKKCPVSALSRDLSCVKDL